MKYDWKYWAEKFMIDELGLDEEKIEYRRGNLSTDSDSLVYHRDNYEVIEIGLGYAFARDFYLEFDESTEAKFKDGLKVIGTMWKAANDGRN